MQKTVVIIDDEADARRVIRKYLERYFPTFQIAAEADNFQDAVNIIEANQPDILFLDIQLNDATGFDVLDKLDIFPQTMGIIFTTAYDQFALKAYQYKALDYLLKPIEPEAFQQSVERIVNLQNQPVSEEDPISSQVLNLEKRVGVPTNEGIKLIAIDSIVFLEADASYCKVFLSDGKTLVVSKPMKFFTLKLESLPYFIKPHKSYFVNLKHLEEYIKEDGGCLRMSNGQDIPISRQKKDEILAYIQRTLL